MYFFYVYINGNNANKNLLYTFVQATYTFSLMKLHCTLNRQGKTRGRQGIGPKYLLLVCRVLQAEK